MKTAKWLVCLILIAGVVAGLGWYYRSVAFEDDMASKITGDVDACPGLPVAHQIMMANSGENLNQLSKYTNTVAAQIPTGMEPLAVNRVNFIDDHVFGAMQRDNIPSTGLASDAEFMRRVYLDTVGRVPSLEDVRVFTSSTLANKRADLIDRLLNSDPFVDRMTLYFGDLLRNSATALGNNNMNVGRNSRNAYHEFIRDFLINNYGYDQVATWLITGTGNSERPDQGSVNFIVRGRQGNVGTVLTGVPGINLDTLDNLAAQTARAFLGVQLECIGCHNGARHLEEINAWLTTKTRSDLWRMSAFFAPVRMTAQRPQAPAITDVTVSEIDEDNPTDNLEYAAYRLANGNPAGRNAPQGGGLRAQRRPGTGENNLFSPRYLLDGQDGPEDYHQYRAALAQMVVSDPQFAKATVNYMWKLFFGVGIVDPPYAFDFARPAQISNPALLNALAQSFVDSGYDLRALISTILNSATYQLSGYWQNARPYEDRFAKYFARHLVRRMSAEQVHDAILMATGTTTSYDLADTGTVNWAHQLPDTAEPSAGSYGTQRNFLNVFERGDRNDNPRPEPRADLRQVIALMNRENGTNAQATNAFIAPRIRYSNTASLVRRLVDDDTLSNADVVDQLFLAALSRVPTAAERSRALQQMDNYAATTDEFTGRKQGAEDVAWMLLNKLDFLLY
jgi:hypothetical protein